MPTVLVALAEADEAMTDGSGFREMFVGEVDWEGDEEGQEERCVRSLWEAVGRSRVEEVE